MDEETKRKFATLEKKIAELEAADKKIIEDVCDYIDDHGNRHLELNKMIYPAYLRTNPEFDRSMGQFYDILKRRSKDSDKPKG